MIPGAFAAIIGFITYFIVFNLNLLISGLRRLFSGPRSFLLTRMVNEKDGSKDDSQYDSQDDPRGSPVTNSTSEVSSVNNSTSEGSSVNDSTSESRPVNNSTSGGNGNAKMRDNQNSGKLSTNWQTRAKAFEVFPRQNEGPRPSNWLLLFTPSDYSF